MRARPGMFTGMFIALFAAAMAQAQPQPTPAQPPPAPGQTRPQSQPPATGQAQPQPAARQARPRTTGTQSATAAERAARITRLGTSDALFRRMTSFDDMRRMAGDKAAQRRVSTAMDAAGLTGLTSEVLAVLSAPDTRRVSEVRVEPGTRLEWMAFRQGTRGRIQRPAIWAGRQPFDAWRFTVESQGTRYHFLLPKACGNLSLEGTEAVPPPPPTTVDDSAERLRREQEARDQAERQRLERERAEREKAEADRRAAEEARKAQEAEQARLAEQRERERIEQERLARERVDWFVAGYFGKERRVREVDVNGANGLFVIETGQCSPLVGAKAGADIRLTPTWRMAPAVGVAFNTDEGDDSSLFAEVEFNRHWDRGFVGTGIGVWDFTHSDTVAPTWLIHFGREIHRQANENRLFLVAEGRLFLNALDDIDNNYQFWGGLRYVVR